MASCSAISAQDGRSRAGESCRAAPPIVLGALILAFGVGCGDDSSPSEDGGSNLHEEDAAASRSDAGSEGGVRPPPSDGGATDARVGSDAATAPRADAATGSGADAASDAGEDLSERRSAGCAMSQAGSGQFETRTMEVGGQTRTYHVRIPSKYSPSRAYPLVMRFHGSGGDGLSGGLGIEYAAGDDAIIVAPDGLNKTWGGRSRQGDLALFDALLETLGDNYCVDLNRVFAYGFSAGAGMTNYLGCVRGDVLRGTAGVANYKEFDDEECVGRVAGWFLQDTDDVVAPLAGAAAARDRLVRVNGCRDTTRELQDDCVQYEGCAPAYPVVWCQTSGYTHNIRGDYAPGAVWEFFSTL